jgi:hypothetical protein
MGGAALEIGKKEREGTVARRDVCVWFVRDCFVFFGGALVLAFLLLSGAFCTFGQGIQFEISE